MSKKRIIHDADISSAGDDFHILWTLKKALGLLNFDDSGIKAIYIEGIERSESKSLDITGEELLGVDLSEYYGADNYKDAEKVVISQLKYSTVRVNKDYTFGELYKGKKSKSSAGSIIHRLASIYKAYVDEFGRDSVLKKLNIKLVTNRGFNQNHLKSINDIKDYLIKKKGKKSINSVLKDNPKNNSSIRKMFLASKLSVTEFTDFIRLLDFDDCGVDSRNNIRIQLYKAISKTSYSSKFQYNQLRELIWDKMMPEARNRRRIVVTDIIASLGFNDGSIENLFPVTQSLEENKSSVLREQLHSIISKILGNSKFLPICLHGGAGMGKSTIIQQIQKHLPENNECIIFDCYGSGSYKNAEDKRHLHKNALLHLSNVLAKKFGADFLIIHTIEHDDVYIKEFKKRIAHSVEVLKQRDADATLTLIIDAADNSLAAADSYGDKSFVQDILNMEIPDGCNLIVTTRTHRKELLKLPDNHIPIKLLPFSLPETTQYIKSYFPKVNTKEVLDFHNYTNGIPRAQFYSIDLKNQGIKEVINFLKPNGKTVESLILDKIEEAKKKVGNHEKILIDDFFKHLIVLPRPVPLTYLSEILDVRQDFLLDISSEVWNGLIYENDHFEFRDEDFENYIRDNYSLDEIDLENITRVFISKAQNDSYASINLGSLLFQSNQFELLKNIVLKREYLLLPGDPIKNRETYISRTKLAMRVSGKDDDNLTYFKLLFIAAEEAKKERALTKLLTDYPDLVSNFGDDTSLNKLKLNSDEKSWAGSFHMKLAGSYSRDTKNNRIALKHLKTAKEWLDWRRNSIKKEELHEYHISSVDIAYYTEAIVRLIGKEEAVKSLNSWTPKDVRLSAGNYLIENLLLFNKNYEINDWLELKQLRIDARIFLISNFFKFNRDLDFDFDQIALDFKNILLRKKIDFDIKFNLLLVDFCEILAFKEINKRLILELLESIESEPPKRIPSFYSTLKIDDDVDSSNLHLRIETLKASLEQKSLVVRDILPERFKDIEKIEDYSKRDRIKRDKEEFTGFFNHVLSIFQLNADFSSKNLTVLECIPKFESICTKFSNNYNLRYQSNFRYKDRLNYLAGLLSDFAVKIGKKELVGVMLKSFDNDSAKIELRFSIVEKTTYSPDFLNINLKILKEIDELLKNGSSPATEVTQSYIRCTLIAQKLDYKVGEYYFNEAVTAIEEIDYEALSKISCLSELSEIGFENSDSKLAYEYARFTEYSDLKLAGYDKKHFPYNAALLGISNLDFNSVFSTASRWHHRGVFDFSKYIVSVLKRSLEKNVIDHVVAGSLVPLYMYNFYTPELIELYGLIFNKYDELRDLNGKTKFVEFLYRNCLLNKDDKTLIYIHNTIQSGAFVEQSTIEKIESYLNFRKSIEKEKTINHVNEFNKEVFKHEYDLDNINVTSTRELEKAINFLIENSDSYSNRWKIDNFLSEIKDKCLPEDYINQLKAIVDIDSELLTFYSLKDALKERLVEWSFYTPLTQWKNDSFRYVILTWFENFDYGNSLSINTLLEFAKMFDVDEIKLAEIIIDILPEKIETLSDESIYSAFFLIKNRLTKKDNTEIFNWILPRWNCGIRSEIADGSWSDWLLPPSNPDKSIANILRMFLGHPDKELRWQAIHSIRRLVNLGNTDILKILLDLQNEKDCIPFQNRGYIFYWISSKLYLWVVLEKLSVETPNKLIEFKDQFLSELQNKELPHVLIKFFIKRTCLNLIKHDEGIYSTDEIKTIKDSLTSKLAKVKEDKYTREQRKYKTNPDEKWKFKFDSMDVLPYWYSRVGDFFNLSEYDVADIAEKYIVEKWGYVGDINEDDYTRNYDWNLRDKRDGSNPRIESLDTYFEYHAMYCAANDLLDKEPLLIKDYDDEWDSWEYWLKSKTITWENFWKSDLRDPLPILEKFWVKEYDQFDKKWRDKINEDKFDNELGLIDHFEGRFIIPFAGYTRYFGENSESVYIRSALVSDKGSEALLRAFQSAKNPHDYAFPLEDDGERFEINNNDLNFRSWLKVCGTEYDGLDKHDYLSKTIDKSIVTIGKNVQDNTPIIISPDLKKSYVEDKLISTYEVWDETSDNEYRDARYVESAGEIFKVDIQFILDILKKENMNMILKCEISRHLKEREYGSYNADRSWEHTKIYLLKSDGKVKTLRGRNFKIR